MTIERGDIYAMAVKGPFTGKPRPVVMMQNGSIALDSVIVVLITAFLSASESGRTKRMG